MPSGALLHALGGAGEGGFGKQRTGFFARGVGFPFPSLHWPGGIASPCVPGGPIALQVPEAHCESAEQNERSPCLGASIAATTNPLPARSFAPRSICARPPFSPWWKTTSEAHLNAAFGAGQGGGRLAVTFGTTIRTGMTSMGGLAPGASRVGSNAPVVGLGRF